MRSDGKRNRKLDRAAQPSDTADVAVTPRTSSLQNLLAAAAKQNTLKAAVLERKGTWKRGARAAEFKAMASGLANLRESKLQSLVETAALDALEFDNRDHTLDELQIAAVHILDLAAPTSSKASVRALWAFVDRVRLGMRANPFHDFRHVVDVLQCMNYMLTIDEVAHRIRDLDRFTLLVACLTHDLGHDGSNNLYLRKAGGPVFERYGTLEAMHAALAEELIVSSGMLPVVAPGVNATSFVADVRALILATDMEKHGELIGAFVASRGDKHLREILIKLADISNVARPFEEARLWSRRLDAELRALAARDPGNASPPLTSIAVSVVGFSTAFAMPIMSALEVVGLAETASIFKAGIVRNNAAWAALDSQVDDSATRQGRQWSDVRPTSARASARSVGKY